MNLIYFLILGILYNAYINIHLVEKTYVWTNYAMVKSFCLDENSSFPSNARCKICFLFRSHPKIFSNTYVSKNVIYRLVAIDLHVVHQNIDIFAITQFIRTPDWKRSPRINTQIFVILLFLGFWNKVISDWDLTQLKVWNII